VPVSKGDAPGTHTKTVFLNNVGGHVAAAPDKKIANVTPEHHIDGLAIACDVLWSLTIVGIAAPISDALLGTFVKTDPNVRVKLEPDEAISARNPMPVYSLGTTTVAATPENADTAPAAKLGSRQSLDEAAGAQADGLPGDDGRVATLAW
jgi:hypothetical protein